LAPVPPPPTPPPPSTSSVQSHSCTHFTSSSSTVCDSCHSCSGGCLCCSCDDGSGGCYVESAESADRVDPVGKTVPDAFALCTGGSGGAGDTRTRALGRNSFSVESRTSSSSSPLCMSASHARLGNSRELLQSCAVLMVVQPGK
jgi:hypothetical protein